MEFEKEFLKSDEACQTVEIALEILKKRMVVRLKRKEIFINQKKRAFIEYYANSIRHLLA